MNRRRVNSIPAPGLPRVAKSSPASVFRVVFPLGPPRRDPGLVLGMSLPLVGRFIAPMNDAVDEVDGYADGYVDGYADGLCE
jgi:hypothetical protein